MLNHKAGIRWTKEPAWWGFHSERCSGFTGHDEPLLSWPQIEPATVCIAAVDCRRRRWSEWLERIVDRETALVAICRHRRFVIAMIGPKGWRLDATDDDAELVTICTREDAAARERVGGAEFHVYLDAHTSDTLLDAINAQRLQAAPVVGNA